MKIEKKALVGMYRKMMTIRRFEEMVINEFHNGAIPGVVHSYIGQEAVAVAVCANLNIDDRIVSNHRGHGHCIAKGADLNRMMAELYGKKTGYCKGKGGSMHIADFSIGMLGANGIVAAGLPIAVGAAFAAQLEGKGRVGLIFFGDGACHEGEFHESLNLAAIWELPVIFVCENNLYGSNIPVRYAIAATNIADMPAAYNIPSVIVDGNDLFAVYDATEQAVARARAGRGPSFLECRTYRWRHHFEVDIIPDLRPTEEVKLWKQEDPIARLETTLCGLGLTSGDMKAIDKDVLSQVEEAVKYAKESPFPAPEDALEDVYSV